MESEDALSQPPNAAGSSTKPETTSENEANLKQNNLIMRITSHPKMHTTEVVSAIHDAMEAVSAPTPPPNAAGESKKQEFWLELKENPVENLVMRTTFNPEKKKAETVSTIDDAADVESSLVRPWDGTVFSQKALQDLSSVVKESDLAPPVPDVTGDRAVRGSSSVTEVDSVEDLGIKIPNHTISRLDEVLAKDEVFIADSLLALHESGIPFSRRNCKMTDKSSEPLEMVEGWKSDDKSTEFGMFDVSKLVEDSQDSKEAEGLDSSLETEVVKSTEQAPPVSSKKEESLELSGSEEPDPDSVKKQSSSPDSMEQENSPEKAVEPYLILKICKIPHTKLAEKVFPINDVAAAGSLHDLQQKESSVSQAKHTMADKFSALLEKDRQLMPEKYNGSLELETLKLAQKFRDSKEVEVSASHEEHTHSLEADTANSSKKTSSSSKKEQEYLESRLSDKAGIPIENESSKSDSAEQKMSPKKTTSSVSSFIREHSKTSTVKVSGVDESTVSQVKSTRVEKHSEPIKKWKSFAKSYKLTLNVSKFTENSIDHKTAQESSDSLEPEAVRSTEKAFDWFASKKEESLEVKELIYIEKEAPRSDDECEDSAENGEAPKQEENDTTEKLVNAKKTVRIQSNENDSNTASIVKKGILKPCPSLGASLENFELNNIPPVIRLSGGHQTNAENYSSMMEEAWERLKKSYVYYKDNPVGTLAAMDPSAEALNYNQVFVRDFVPCGLACLMREQPPEAEIVKNFLLKTLHLQGWEKRIDNFTLGEGVMPASFKVLYDPHRQKEILVADFGGSAIGRVAPVDSGFWWIILLRSYTKCTRDYTLSELPEVQRGMKLILNLCLSDGFDTFPTLLCADGCSMIDRRMGIYGYPIEIQALFYFALRCARQMLKPERDGKELLERIDKRITALSYHIRTYYWLDFTQLNNIYRYKTEEYSHTAVNKFNVMPESIPNWVFDFMTLRGGYLIGNVSPARMDFRWFLVGNCIAILSSLTTPSQATAIMDLIEERWEDLIGEMPLKIVYPALQGNEWRTVTGFDPKNTRWSYHNGGSWPVLLWLLTAACIKTGRPQIAKRAIELVEQRLSKDGWPEYYDGKTGRYVGKQARKYQTWSISGYLVAKMMIENPANLLMISLEEDKKTANAKLARSTSF